MILHEGPFFLFHLSREVRSRHCSLDGCHERRVSIFDPFIALDEFRKPVPTDVQEEFATLEMHGPRRGRLVWIVRERLAPVWCVHLLA